MCKKTVLFLFNFVLRNVHCVSTQLQKETNSFMANLFFCNYHTKQQNCAPQYKRPEPRSEHTIQFQKFPFTLSTD